MRDNPNEPICCTEASPTIILVQFLALGIISALLTASVLYWAGTRLYAQYSVASRPSVASATILFAVLWLAFFAVTLRWFFQKRTRIEDPYWLKHASVSASMVAGGAVGTAFLLFSVPMAGAFMAVSIIAIAAWTYGKADEGLDGTVVDFGSFARNGLTVIYKDELIITPSWIEAGLAAGACMLFSTVVFAL